MLGVLRILISKGHRSTAWTSGSRMASRFPALSGGALPQFPHVVASQGCPGMGQTPSTGEGRGG